MNIVLWLLACGSSGFISRITKDLRNQELSLTLNKSRRKAHYKSHSKKVFGKANFLKR